MRRARVVVLSAAAITGCGSAPDDRAVDTSQAQNVTPTLAVAESLYSVGAHDSAEVLFRVALDGAERRGDSTSKARLLTWLGMTAWRLGEYDDARRLGRQALDIKVRLGLDGDLFQSYNALGLLAYTESRYIDAVTNQEQAIRIAEESADTANLAKAWTNLAIALFELGDYDRALGLLTRSLSAATKAGNKRVEGRILINVGMATLRMGAPADAIAPLQRGRSLAGESGDHLGELNALGQLASAWTAMAEHGNAIAVLDTMLQLARQPGRESRLEEASALDQLAEVLLSAGDSRRALSTLQQAINIQSEEELPHERAVSLRKVAAIHSSLGNSDLADSAASEAVTVHRGLAARLETILDLVTLAELRHRARRRDDAWRLLAEARSMARGGTSISAVPLVSLSEARLFDAEQRSSDVLRVARDNGAAISEAGADFQWELHAMVARALRRLGRREPAIEAAQMGVAAVERIRGALGSSVLRTSYLSERSSVYGELAGLLLDAGRVADALAVADAARGRAVLEHDTAAPNDASPSAVALAEEESKLLQQIDALATMAAESKGDTDLETEAARTRERLERARSAFSERFARGEHGAAGRHTLPVDSLQALLAPDEVLVEFMLTDRDALIFAVTRDGVVGVRATTNHDELVSRVRVARELAGRADAPEAVVRATFGALGKTLLGSAPIQAALMGKRTMVIVPNADLVYLPFASLINPATNRFVVEDLAMTQSPSASLVARTRGERGGVAGKSVEVFAPFTRDLPYSASEARAVRMSSFRRKAFTNRAASEAELRRALSSASVVHVATHGILNRQNPLFSRIDVARPRNAARNNDGRLEVHEVLGIQIRAALVFLSGCDTGVGVVGSTQFERGEDFATLAQSFLMAGAKNVIATLWPVQDDGAAIFAQKFYAALASAPPGDRGAAMHALAQAQREMRTDSRFAAPYYWAGYTLSGTGWIGDVGASK